jgi:uncharacterized protein (TIGR00369 family)
LVGKSIITKGRIMSQPIPEGFNPHFRKSPLTDPWEPLYSRLLEDRIVLGLRADERHCNSRGIVHGGLITALADNAMGLSCVAAYKAKGFDIPPLVTITLHVDFLRAGSAGQWIEFSTTAIKTGAKIAAAQGVVTADGRDSAYCSATFSAA